MAKRWLAHCHHSDRTHGFERRPRFLLELPPKSVLVFGFQVFVGELATVPACVGHSGREREIENSRYIFARHFAYACGDAATR